jgi:cytoskeletal protein RodZ
MTARQQIRAVRLGRERSPIDATPAPSVGETLQAARERKGVDLYRAERDTKIRARHLAALESGDYTELPGSVYTKGFLRNYALYLGLDPEDLLSRWRDEQDFGRKGEPVQVTPPPQPLEEPRRGFTFSPGILIAAGLTVIVLLFAGYIGLQLVRFTQVPQLSLEGDRVVRLAPDATTVLLRGTAGSMALINVAGPDGSIIQTASADDAGAWQAQLGVSKGRNDFTLTARDPDTGRESEPLAVIAMVPVDAELATPAPTQPAASLAPDATAAPVPTQVATVGTANPLSSVETLALSSPNDGGSLENKVLTVAGTSDAASVTVAAAWAGEGDGPRRPGDQTLKVRDGRFEGIVTLPAGRWALTVTTAGQGGAQPASQTATVDIAYKGQFVTVEARDGSAWIRVWVDGEIAEEGHTFRRGELETFQAKRAVVVSTGNAGATWVTVNGEVIGAIGKDGQLANVELAKGKAPRALD